MRFGGRRSVLVQSSAVLTNGFCGALRFCDGLRVVRRILAPLVLAAAAVWQPPAAKEGQGDCDFPLGPPWILLYPLKRRRSARGRWRHGLAAARRARGRLALCGVSSPLFGGGRGWPLRGGRGVDIGFAADKRRCFGGGWGWPLRGRRGDDSGVAAARRSFPGRAREGRGPLASIRLRRRVRRKCGNFFVGELAPRRRNCFLADSPSAPFGRRRICVGVAVAGELAPPSTWSLPPATNHRAILRTGRSSM